MLFAVWELDPFIKVGGLGDIARSLPRALKGFGVDVRVVIPYYTAVKLKRQKKELLGKFFVRYAKKQVAIKIFRINFVDSDIPVYLLQNNKYLSVPQRETFAVFDLAVVEMLVQNVLAWQPEVIHCNDNHCGLVPALVKKHKLKAATLLTIHALHQGRADPNYAERAGLARHECRLIDWEIPKRQLNFLLEGIVHADGVNTVSETYAQEIMTEEYGAGLDDIFRKEQYKITGILNGIDYDLWNPSTSKNLTKNYSLENVTEGKSANKLALQRKYGFKVSYKMPVVAFVGRMDPNQKGIELIHKMLLRMAGDGVQFLLIGEGESDWEERFIWLNSFYPQSVRYIDDYSHKMAEQFYAGSDMVMIPSKFEPCGQIQMIGMRYGALPVARATGGLKDTIVDGENGFLFDSYSSHELEKKLRVALKMWKDEPKRFSGMQQAAMRRDFTWKKSAQKYLSIYERLVDSRSRV